MSLYGERSWSQNGLANELCLSPSQVNSALKRLVYAGLITPYLPPLKPEPIFQACEEFFIHGLKYAFPEKLGSMVRGEPASVGALNVLKLGLLKSNEPGQMDTAENGGLRLMHYTHHYLNQ